MNPTVGQIVHYVSYGTPGGEYTSQCRAAIVTEVTPLEGEDAAQADVENWDADQRCRVSLAVLNPTGMFFVTRLWRDDTHKRSGTWHQPEAPGCPHCPDGHTPPDGGSQPWGAYLGPADGATDRMTTATMNLADRETQQLRAELRRYTEAESADAAAGSYAHRAETAEHRLHLAHQARRAKEHQLDDIRRALCDTGLIDDEDPYSHADLADVIRQTATEPAAWTPPPPGDTREQLPDHILALLDGYISPYRSTACDTAGSCERAWRKEHPHMAGLIWEAKRLHQRCRLNNKFTGQLCICPCHTDTPKEPRP